MSIESPEEINGPEVIETANQLIEEHPILKEDIRTQNIMRSNGVTSEGKVVNLIDYLGSRLDVLNEQKENGSVAAEGKHHDAGIDVVYSVRPDLEDK